MPFPDLLVLRHGQTEWNAAGRHQGQLDSPLTPLGLAQARQQGEILARMNLKGWQAACSPLGRAVETAKIALADTGLVPRLDDRLREVHFGAWQGLTANEIAAKWPALGADRHDPFAWNFRSPGGERFEDMARRAQSFLDGLSQPTVVIAHGVFLRVLRGLWLGIGPDAMRDLDGGQGVVHQLHSGQQTRHGGDV